MMGHIAFGVIDRGTNVIQVRPSTLCPHACIYCSVDAGPASRWRQTEYIVDADDLVRWVAMVASVKGPGVEALLDGVGEPLTHPRILYIISRLRGIPEVRSVALETHGGFLSKRLAEKLDEAGLQRVNLSLDTLDPGKARLLAGVPWYDVGRIVKVVEWMVENTGIDVVLTPVIVPGYNDSEEDIASLVELARSLGLGSKVGWPTGVLPQKYEAHKYGRKPRGVKPWSWGRFYKWLREMEARLGYRLHASMSELGMEPRPRVAKPYRAGDRVPLRVVGPGWLRGELLAVDARGLRAVTLIGGEHVRVGQRVVARIIRDKDNIYLARV
ncbi:radical SAM protein [Stetteria hydrogenophila]